jgi:CRISPR-associated protein Cmr3
VAAILNSPFSITAILPARCDAKGETEIFLPLPADVLVMDEGKTLLQLEPQHLDDRLLHNQTPQLPMLPVLRQDKPEKPERGWLLNQTGIQAYLQGQKLSSAHVTRQADLWASESRIGIGLNRVSRTVDEGKLFTVEHTATVQMEHWCDSENKTPAQDTTGLVVGIEGYDELPEQGFIRLGGDGRAARYTYIDTPEIPSIIIEDKFKLVLLTPGVFNKGWLPNGVIEDGGEFRLSGDAFKARLACVAVARAEVVSGWDLVQWQPKTAERVAPAGSVYWFDNFTGDAGELAKWVAGGIWSENRDSVRHAEGFNRAWLASWH